MIINLNYNDLLLLITKIPLPVKVETRLWCLTVCADIAGIWLVSGF